jgi:hypothetical protein
VSELTGGVTERGTGVKDLIPAAVGANVARIEQREIRDCAARLAPDFVSLNPGYACYACLSLEGQHLRRAIGKRGLPVELRGLVRAATNDVAVMSLYNVEPLP